MLRWIHPAIGLVLLISHSLFFFRALKMRRTGDRPGRVDRLARNLSHLGLPLAIISGIALPLLTDIPGESGLSVSGIIHIILGLAPLAAIFIFTPLLPLKRRIPWLLPSINLLFFLAAVLTGFAAGFVLH